jgi:hypothetical protein
MALPNASQVGIGGLQDLNPLDQQILPDQGGRRMPMPPEGGFPGLWPPRGGPKIKDPFQGFQDQLTGFGETLGGLGEQFTGFGDTIGGYNEQITDFGSQLGGLEKHFGGINDRLSKIEEGIATLVPKEQAQAAPQEVGQQQMQQHAMMNPYMMNPYMGLMSLFGGMGRSGGYF